MNQAAPSNSCDKKCQGRKMLRTILMAALIVATQSVAAAPISVPERLVTGGIISGETLPDGGTVFRGVPYAQPPVGELRWKPPAPVELWQSVRDATKSGPPCLQRSYEWNAGDAATSKEDCLYLDVQSPAHKSTDRLPVMVWIHGGANRAGSGIGYTDSPITRRGVVLVTLQYRLGIFGFASLPALTAESPQHASGNYGIMDQIAALQWVKANIANFGGDPDNVTIFGQSAGAQDVGLLMLSPLARGLFHKATEESGTAGFGVPPRTLAENERIGDDLAALMGVPAGADGLKTLRAASGEALLDATDKLLPPSNVDPMFIWLQAVIDGWVLPRAPAEILAAGEQARVPLIIGNAIREFGVAAAWKSARQFVEDNFGDGSGEALALYGLNAANPPPDDPLLGSIVDQVSADVIFRCPASWVANRQLAVTPHVWRYQFSISALDTVKAVEHSAELKYVFQKTPAGATSSAWPPLQVYWTNFAKTGNPNARSLPKWPNMGKAQNYMEFTAQGPRVGKDLRGPLCRLLSTP
jgi:para-nitrobenzyl esterase